jgi:hypothetical protein
VEWEGGEEQRRRPPVAEGDTTVFFLELGEELHGTAYILHGPESSLPRHPTTPSPR